MKELIIGTLNPEQIKQDHKGKPILHYDGKELKVDQIREIENHSELIVIIENADKLNRSCVAALLKIIEEGSTNFILQTNSILRINQAIASRCTKKYESANKTSPEQLKSNLTNAEQAVIDNIIGKGSLTKNDIYEKIDYRKILAYLTQLYATKTQHKDIATPVWKKIENIILQPQYKASLYAVYAMMEN